MIERIKIENYKNFQSFEYDGFKRVNLIAGKNNVGKTNLLEAIYLAEVMFDPMAFIYFHSVRNSLEIRGDGKSLDPVEADSIFEDALDAMLFNNDRSNEVAIKIDNESRYLKFSNFVESHNLNSSTGQGSVTLNPTDVLNPHNSKLAFGAGIQDNPYYLKFYGYPFNPITISSQLDQLKRRKVRFLMANDVTPIHFEELYNQVLLEKNLIFFQKLSELVFGYQVNDLRQFTELKSKKKHFRVADKEANFKRIGEFGYGTNRMLKMFLLQLTSKDGCLFFDEVDSGIHYSKQEDFWRMVFEISSELKVQIFATTHSRDCFEAFAKVANEPKNQGQGKFVRLSDKSGKIRAVDYEDRDIMAAAESGVEVR